MIGLEVSVPIACFRRGLARELLETEQIPPPSTCYGFLLSLVGETDRSRHIGCGISVSLIGEPSKSVVMRTAWRHKIKKDKGDPVYPGQKGNKTPALQEILTGVRLVVWLDSAHERGDRPTLEQRVMEAMEDPAAIGRFGGLSLGESSHLVDEVSLWNEGDPRSASTFHVDPRGRLSLPVWVDHIGSSGTRYAIGDLREGPLTPPHDGALAVIASP